MTEHKLTFVNGIYKAIQSANGLLHKIQFGNIVPTKQDGTPDKYYQGHLLWYDPKSQKYFRVKSFQLKNAPAHTHADGGIHSLALDLTSTYDVVEETS